MPVDRGQALGHIPPGHQLVMADAMKLLLDVDDILGKAGVPYWLFFGTLLGVYRDKGLIPHDGDIDLILRAEDEKAVVALEEQFIARGCKNLGTGSQMVTTSYRLEHVDFNLFRKEGSMRRWPGFEIPAQLIEEDAFLEFAGRKFRVPAQTEKCLLYCYGPEWTIDKKGIILSSAIGGAGFKWQF